MEDCVLGLVEQDVQCVAHILDNPKLVARVAVKKFLDLLHQCIHIVCLKNGAVLPILRPERLRLRVTNQKHEEMEYVTLEWIMRHLKAEQAIQYFKERGMNVCPINLQ